MKLGVEKYTEFSRVRNSSPSGCHENLPHFPTVGFMGQNSQDVGHLLPGLKCSLPFKGDLSMKEGSLFCNYEIHLTGMLQIVFLMSLESSR
jgi:hypothetical protein